MSSINPSFRWITILDAAQRKNVSTKTIRRYITQGLIEAERVGPRLIRVNLASLASLDQLGLALPHDGGALND